MAYVNPKLNAQFSSLSPELQQLILQKDVKLDTLQDLMNVLEKIIAEEE